MEAYSNPKEGYTFNFVLADIQQLQEDVVALKDFATYLKHLYTEGSDNHNQKGDLPGIELDDAIGQQAQEMMTDFLSGVEGCLGTFSSEFLTLIVESLDSTS